MSNNTLDAGIPVLTEIIPAPAIGDADDTGDGDAPADTAVAAGVAAPSAEAGQIVPLAANLPAPLQLSTANWNEAEWERLERQVQERVLGQILDRVDVMLEQRVRDSLADVLQVAVERLANEIREGLHHSIKDAVTRAVTQEIASLQVSKK
ncbi:hypothetical protein [Noviherbaspirillum aerium]|uniref:hypothetical protein n=1 Tax=Noviherbaspirillum aerium TaxID=2588497 RepID=UPI00124D00AB|nr:hypothetical protein [Noviherbaspirillum aerium]